MANLEQIDVGGVTYDVADAGALRKNQGAENAGKVMTVGADGETTPQDKATRSTAALSTSGWAAGTGGYYVQTVSITGVTEKTDFDYDCELTGSDAEADAVVVEAFGLVVYAESVAGGIQFQATDAPGANIPVILRVYG